ncbi:hypothetical protein [Sulfurimonas sp.]
MEEKVLITIRIPSQLHDKILKVSKNELHNRTKTDIVVAILEKFFSENEEKEEGFVEELEDHFANQKNSKNELVDELENMFSLGEKIFMSRKVYKQILQKSESKVEYEIRTGFINSIVIAGIDFVVLESSLDTNSIVVEQILQKKELSMLKKRVDILDSKIFSHK